MRMIRLIERDWETEMKQWLSVLASVVILAIAACGVWIAARWVMGVVNEINPNVAVAIVAASATTISSVIVASYNARKAKERVAHEANREVKAAVYNDFMKTMVQAMRSSGSAKKRGTIAAHDLEEFFFKFVSQVAVYGGPGVIKAFADWQASATKEDGMHLQKMDRLLREMRADLGESNKGVQDNELLGLFIRGGKSMIEQEMAAVKKNAATG